MIICDTTVLNQACSTGCGFMECMNTNCPRHQTTSVIQHNTPEEFQNRHERRRAAKLRRSHR